MRRRSPARWLAPLAILACAFAVYAVVNASLRSDDSGGSRSTVARSSTTSSNRTVSERSPGSGRRRGRRRTYTVQSGDTLSSIAVKTGTTLERLQRLNPNLDAQSLHAGQLVKLSP